ncbi:MAG: type II secretion system F family protein [Planctomycetota bacterium]|nr:type II secretion system F family protein [Planctomycetota bacterium]
MSADWITTLLIFTASAGAWLVAATLLSGQQTMIARRLDRLGEKVNVHDPSTITPQMSFSEFTQKMGAAVAPTNAKEQSALKARLLQAGLYHPKSLAMFMGVKLMLTFTPLVIGGVCCLFAPAQPSYLPVGKFLLPAYQTYAMTIGLMGAMLGNVVPGFWLDSQAKNRQTAFRRGLPDCMDLMVISLEGGLSLSGAVQRVGNVLGNVHPILAREILIVERRIQMGMGPGESLMEFGLRSGLDEIRRLAAVVIEAERLGGSMAKTLRTHAEALREQRTQRAEEMAHKAGVKILFPTVLLIFPAMFIVILGPASIQIARTLLK